MTADITRPFAATADCGNVKHGLRGTGTAGVSGAKDGTIDVHLRSQHVDYLNFIARRDEISLSRAFGLLLERYAETTAVPLRAERKDSKHLRVEPEHLKILDSRAARAGLSRSDLSRRLIDAAIEAELIPLRRHS